MKRWPLALLLVSGCYHTPTTDAALSALQRCESELTRPHCAIVRGVECCLFMGSLGTVVAACEGSATKADEL